MATVERNEIFDLAYRFITETRESIFLTGKAGTGKTTFLKYLREHACKNMIVAAPTGVAAINAGGVTLHSLFQLPFHPFLPTENNRRELLSRIRYQKQRLQLLRKIELLVIDEISMVRCDVLDAVDTILKSVRRNHKSPFGGVQVIYIGDLFQLPPVAKKEEWEQLLNEYYPSPFFFDSKAVKEQSPLLIELTEIYRQKEQGFVDLLNKVRNNNMTDADYELLNKRYIPAFDPPADKSYITLTSHNHQADAINATQLHKLPSAAFTYKARIEGDFPESIFPAEHKLVLKEGTQVMFIKNDPVSRRYFNGKIGVVTALDEEKIIVNCNGDTIEVAQEVWENTRYTLNRSDEKLEQQVLGKFFQYPLRLAWAVTIHKSQGLTFDNVMIDAASSFSSGQVYVALSRCTSLEGIILLSKLNAAAIHSNEMVVTAQSSLAPKGSLPERFEGARQLFTLQLLSDIFLLEELELSLRLVKYAVERNREKLNNEAFDWIIQYYNGIRQLQFTGEKFISHVQELLHDTPVIESNPALQKRIQDAAGYFLPLLEKHKASLLDHPIITEHKEVSSIIDENMQEAISVFSKAIWMMQYCKEAFTIAGCLKHKLELSVPRTHVTSYAAGKRKIAETDVPNAELYLDLRNWRDTACTEQDLPIYMIANNSSLKEIATYLPLTPAHLQELSGFGKAKTDKYGEEILAIVHAYCNRHHLETNIELKKDAPKRKRKQSAIPKAEKTSSASVSLQMFKNGMSAELIAKERKVTTGTVEGHLVGFIKTGELPVDVFAGSDDLKIIAEAFSVNPNKPLGEVRTLLNDRYSFTQLRAVSNYLEWVKTKELASADESTPF